MRKRDALAVSAIVLVLALASAYYGFSASTSAKSSSTISSGTTSSRLSSPTTSSLTKSSSISSPTSQSSSSFSVNTSTPPGSQGWTTYHEDNARSGFIDLGNFTTVSPDWNSPTLDEQVYAEPLVYGSSVFVATENNTVWSLDAQTGAILWRTDLGTPVAGSQLQCGDIDPSGITGTPVIDSSTGTIFVVAFTHLHHFLIGLSTRSGAVVSNQSADPPGFVVTAQQQRSALSLSGGEVYVPYGGLAGDCGQYHGWVVGLPARGNGSMAVYMVPTSREGGLWAPSGAAIDSSGGLYIATGNGASGSSFDHGNSVIALTPSLSEVGYFAPTNWAQLNDNDADLGSVGPAIVGPGLLFQIGKEGVGYLLNASNLGGVGGETFSLDVCSGGYGGTAFSSPYIYVPCGNGLFALKLGSGSFTPAWHTDAYDAGPPIVTGGVVWTVDTSSATLYGYSASGGGLLYSFPLGSVDHFCTPAAGDGRVFVAAGNVVTAFTLGSSGAPY